MSLTANQANTCTCPAGMVVVAIPSTKLSRQCRGCPHLYQPHPKEGKWPPTIPSVPEHHLHKLESHAISRGCCLRRICSIAAHLQAMGWLSEQVPNRLQRQWGGQTQPPLHRVLVPDPHPKLKRCGIELGECCCGMLLRVLTSTAAAEDSPVRRGVVLSTARGCSRANCSWRRIQGTTVLTCQDPTFRSLCGSGRRDPRTLASLPVARVTLQHCRASREARKCRPTS